MQRSITLLSLFVLTATAIMGTSSAFATYYQYVDGSGSVVMTNSKESVPPKYRAHMKVIKDETLEQKDPGAKKAPPAAASQDAPADEPAAAAHPAEPQGRFAEISAKFPWFKPLVYLVGFLASLLALFKVTTLLPSRQMGRLVCLAYFLGVGVFIYKSYIDYAARSYSEIRKESEKAVKKSYDLKKYDEALGVQNPGTHVSEENR